MRLQSGTLLSCNVKYVLNVKATDGGAPSRSSNTAMVRIDTYTNAVLFRIVLAIPANDFRANQELFRFGPHFLNQ